MYKSILTCILLIAGILAEAKCSSNGIWCWPFGNTITTTPVLVITFYGVSQSVVPLLGTKNKIFLQSGEQKIPLIVKEINKGEFALMQILVTPTIALTEGLEYELIMESMPQYERITKYNNTTGKSGAPKWRVINNKNYTLPQWIEVPKYNSKTMVEYGCGPAKWVNFNLKYSASSAVLIKTTVKSIKTQKSTTFYVDKNDDIVKVGFGMCAGEFYFNEGDLYEVFFVLMDESGNLSRKNSKPIRFSRPTETTEEE